MRRTRIGEVSAHQWQWDHKIRDAWQFLLHYDDTGVVDGAANYRTPWSPDVATAGAVEVDWLEATTVTAYSDLWMLLTGLDLDQTGDCR